LNDSPNHHSHAPGQKAIGLSHWEQGEIILAHLALAALGIIVMLALLAPAVALPDKLVLLPFGLATLSFLIPSVLRRVVDHREVAAFILTAAMFLVYNLARTAGPTEGFALRFAALPDDSFVVPYSAYVAIFAALFSGPFWWRRRDNWTNSVVAGIAIIALLTLGIFSILRQYFPTGPTEILDPTPLPTLAMKLVEYGCVALLCHAVTSHKQTRRLALRLLPGVLLVLWARHQFFVPPEAAE